MNEDYIGNYKLSNVDDLFKEKNIYVYYILFKYVLKDTLYIYQNEFLYNARKVVVQSIHFHNKNLSDLTNFLNSNHLTNKKDIKALKNQIEIEFRKLTQIKIQIIKIKYKDVHRLRILLL